MQATERAQLHQGGLGQRHQSILIALGIAHVNTLSLGVDVADLHAQSLTQAQAEAVEGEEQYAVAAHPGGGEELPDLPDGDDTWVWKNFRP